MVKVFWLHTPVIRTIFFVCFCVFASFSTKAQTNNTDFILKKANDYLNKTPQEKVFVHTDRTSYVAGEIVWFKLYCLDGANNQLSQLSKVAYVEVIDKDNVPVMQAKIALKDGMGDGSFVIPQSIHSGNFLLRSYTSWMKNFDAEFYFHQKLIIINTIKPEAINKEKIESSYDVQFFPEGGNLVGGLQSKVAFRVTDNTGKGISFNGAIVDEKNDTILHFNPLAFGIGNFTFTPKQGSVYHAIIKTKGENVFTQDLPVTLNVGYVLQVADASSNDSLRFTISTNTNDFYAFLLIHSGSQAKTAQLINFRNGIGVFSIDKKALPEGIATVTVFNQNNQPVCERLYFTKPSAQLVITANANKARYGVRKKVTVSLQSKNQAESIEPSEMSMAVFLLDSLPLQQHNIYNYVWMSSELKGNIESPEFYFSGDKDVKEATDNLMLTHGFRRLKWNEILTDQKPVFKFLPEVEGYLVTGKVVNKITEMPGKDVLSFLSVPGPVFQLYSAKSNDEGSIYFNTKNFYGSRLVVGQTKKPESDSFRLDFVSPFSDSFSSVKPGLYSVSKTSNPAILRRSINMQVQNEYVGKNLDLFETLITDTVAFYGKADARYMLDDYVRFPTMEEVLREYVREINVKKRRDNFLLTNVTKDEFGNPIVKEPVVLLDGVPQFDDGNKISHYDPLKVRKLEVVEENYFLGPASFNGIASFSTYNGDLEGFRLDTASTVIDYDALQMRREFYSPKYETQSEYSTRLPDFRTLLYWSPNITTDATGRKEVTFYTSDQAGKYVVVLQGISKQGKSGSAIFTIEVKNGE